MSGWVAEGVLQRGLFEEGKEKEEKKKRRSRGLRKDVEFVALI